MALITWNAEQHETKVAFADDEHKILFGKLNKLYDLATGGAERNEVGQALDDLIAYVVEHFAHEEKEMQAKNFSGYAAHKAEHDALVGICADLQEKFGKGEADVTEDTGALVKNWLDSHIPTFDRAYESTLNS
ncbi:bacteriohemerythrin [methanotrophic endosymbiont of Bathymodiolus puteoserpentis (Logatchev)]|uniref:bacteriohemerythrin n=1 Tax=methanotrophic endosymbiont of Bathymodiolus puteoserpentis (Logatchev) TaxID=343235 RepID=UPI0013C7BBEB|nr:bacteriohemerythrin [methanotrophic endosymbiont of Bathymodiolus puteoserpentis (Logatchev)]SHE22800.1 Hemerythrin [methanotrophic endosymbiont of Bathymodiolus puteoserpentis (Logatchev)]